jgi:hypothetical protein
MRILIAIGCYMMSAWSLFSALDRATSVYRYSHVGGDAYNLIINGTHATALLVFASMLAIIGTLSLLSLQLSRLIEAIEANRPLEQVTAATINDDEAPVTSTPNDSADDA